MLTGLSFIAVALAWLQPWAPPPAPSVPGLVTAWGMTGLLALGLHHWRLSGQTTPSLSTSFPLLGGLLGLTLWAGLWVPYADPALIGGLWGSLLCIFLAYRIGQQTTMVRPMAQSLLGVALICALLGCVQYAGGMLTPGQGFDWLHASPQRDAYANLRQRNQFGTLMAIGLASWLYLQETVWQRTRLVHWMQLGLLTVGAVISCSRAGALSWLLLTVLWAFCLRKARSEGKPSAWLAPAVAAGLFLALSGMLPSMTTSDAHVTTPPAPMPALSRATAQAEGLDICESRLVLWRNVLELSLQRPWTGWGFGELDYAMATQPLSGTRFCGIVAHAHNLPLQLIVEWGWPMALGWMALASVWLWRRRPRPFASPSVRFGWALLLPLGVHSLLEFPLWYGPFQMTLGLALGFASGSGASTPARKSIAGGLVLAISLTAGAAWGALDYVRVSQLYLPAHLRLMAGQQHPLLGVEHVFWFRNAVDFARLMSPGLTPEAQKQLALRLVHYSPEPAVMKHLEPGITQPR